MVPRGSISTARKTSPSQIDESRAEMEQLRAATESLGGTEAGADDMIRLRNRGAHG